ncbi:unnamed protein product [Cochlearia groenlandica]
MAFTKISLVLCLLGLYYVTVKSQNPRDGGSVSSIVTKQFFENIIKKTGSGCPGKTFYTRDSFVNAANTFPDFGNSVTRREIATMFAHFTHDTGHFCFIEYIRKRYKKKSFPRRRTCSSYAEQEDCDPPVKGYFGSGQRLSIDLLHQPAEHVGSNPTEGFKTSMFFWMNSVRPVLNQGFGATIKTINEMECKGGDSGAVNERIRYYREYCGQLGVDPGSNLSC